MNFRNGWQEVIQYAPSGEKHIADIHTEHGLTVEFQHSYLRAEERTARELFYRNMVWVVDGARLSRDFPRFVEGCRSFRMIGQNGVYIAPFPNEAFPKNWLTSTMPVFFDFSSVANVPDETKHLTASLWCLLPGHVDNKAVVLRFSPSDFVARANERSQMIATQPVFEIVASVLAQERARQEAEYLAAFRQSISNRRPWRSTPRGGGRRRRF